MRLFQTIARLPLTVVWLTMALLTQSLVMAHANILDAPQTDEHFSYVICSDGELKTIIVGSDGSPVEHDHSDAHCPLCIAGFTVYLTRDDADFYILRDLVGVGYLNAHAVTQNKDMRPDRVQGQDPPSS